MAWCVGKRCGVAAIFWGVEGGNCDVFEKSFFSEPSTSEESVFPVGVFSVDKIHPQTHNL
jgi:hypothetical protein